jgi:putative two-component system response regulator
MGRDAEHTTIGYHLVSNLRSMRLTAPIIRHHHERWDGSGYPDRLAGEAIPLLARVFQIVDIHDALTSSGPTSRHERRAGPGHPGGGGRPRLARSGLIRAFSRLVGRNPELASMARRRPARPWTTWACAALRQPDAPA